MRYFDTLYFGILHINYIFTCYVCISTIEQPCNLFQCRTLRLHEEEPDTKALNNKNSDVYEVKLPGQVLKANWIN